MIFAITGKVEETDSTWLVLSTVSGVSYEIEMPLRDLHEIKAGQEMKVYIHQVVREDAHLLYGFCEQVGQKMFRQLIKVNGVGPKVALNILSQLSISELVDSIRMQKLGPLIRVKGLGKRGAEKLLVALKDKLDLSLYLTPGMINFNAEEGARGDSSLVNDAVDALIALGYQRQKAYRVVEKIAEEVQDLTEVIRLALQKM